MGNYRLKASCKLLRGVATVGETPSLTGESSLEGGARTEQASSSVPSLTPPPHTVPQCSDVGCLALVNTLNYITSVLRQRNMTEMKEQIKTPKIELSNEKIANLSDAEFKTLVIRMLTEMVEYGSKIEEKVKAMQTEIKENV